MAGALDIESVNSITNATETETANAIDVSDGFSGTYLYITEQAAANDITDAVLIPVTKNSGGAGGGGNMDSYLSVNEYGRLERIKKDDEEILTILKIFLQCQSALIQ